jgi:hypothetical protein
LALFADEKHQNAIIYAKLPTARHVYAFSQLFTASNNSRCVVSVRQRGKPVVIGILEVL